MLFLFPLVSTSIFASKLPELATKQDVSNLRFISSSGKFTYYQNSNGQLLLSTNFKVSTTLKLQERTHYSLTSSYAKKLITIEANENYHNFLSLRKRNKIYTIAYGEDKSKLVGEGSNPRLHFNDKLISFYDTYSKEISLHDTSTYREIAKIKINGKVNPFFRPEIATSDLSTVYYTDINSNGVQAILKLDRKTKKTTVSLKAPSPLFKYELCESKDRIYIGEFPLSSKNGGSLISFIEKGKDDFSKRTIIYSSESQDLGNLICNNEVQKIAFIQRDKQTDETELVEINIKDKSIKKLSDLKNVTSAINMDSRLLIPHYGKIYLVKGDNNLPFIDKLDQTKTTEGSK